MLDNFDFSEHGISDDVKAAILKATEAEVDGLKSKNDDLLGKLRKAKDSGTASASELERLRNLEKGIQVKEAEDQKNYEEALRLAGENHKKEMDALQAKLDIATGTIDTLLIDNGISTALDGLNVHKDLKEAATALMRSKAEVRDGAAFIGEQPLAEHIAAWGGTDAAKSFIAAADNSGGGSNGGKPGDSSGKKFSQMGSDERTTLFKTNPEEYNRLKEADAAEQAGARKF